MEQRADILVSSGKADLHVHTTHSDGTASVADVLAFAAEKTDLRLVAITDHDTITGALEAQRLAREFGVEVVVGEEVSTAEGHLLALFIETLLPPGRPAAETISAIHAQGGLAIAPHPFDYMVSSLGARDMAAHCADGSWQIDAIEGFNASVMWPNRTTNSLARQCARNLDLPVVGGSDAHSLTTLGMGYTLFDGSSSDDLYRAIRIGQVTWGGSFWNLAQYFDVARQWVRQRSIRGALRVVLAGGSTPLQR